MTEQDFLDKLQELVQPQMLPYNIDKGLTLETLAQGIKEQFVYVHKDVPSLLCHLRDGICDLFLTAASEHDYTEEDLEKMLQIEDDEIGGFAGWYRRYKMRRGIYQEPVPELKALRPPRIVGGREVYLVLRKGSEPVIEKLILKVEQEGGAWCRFNGKEVQRYITGILPLKDERKIGFILRSRIHFYGAGPTYRWNDYYEAVPVVWPDESIEDKEAIGYVYVDGKLMDIRGVDRSGEHPALILRGYLEKTENFLFNFKDKTIKMLNPEATWKRCFIEATDLLDHPSWMNEDGFMLVSATGLKYSIRKNSGWAFDGPEPKKEEGEP